MIERIGIVGVGHLAGYLVEGWQRAAPSMEIILSPRNVERSARLASRFGAQVVANNQAVADAVDLVLLCTRPGEVVAACQGIVFRPEQTVISVAVGLPWADLQPTVAPAVAVRALPISCAAINQSPTLLYPDHPQVRALFDLLGRVFVLTGEDQFTAASTISAFYGWVYALLDETSAWTIQAGVPAQMARDLVLETVRGATGMALAQPEQELGAMLDTLATPGGITEHGLQILDQRQSFVAWREALEAVLHRLSAGCPALNDEKKPW